MTIGWEEILMLMVFALLIFGPKRLPEIARQVGRFMGEIRRMSHEFEREVRDVTDPFQDEFRKAADPFRRELTAALDPEEAEIRRAEADAGVTETYELDENHSTFMPPKRDT
jgi:sec-independent protein translocase protein TatB